MNTYQQCLKGRPQSRAVQKWMGGRGRKRAGGGGGGTYKGWGGHLLGNRAWAWGVRTSLWDRRLGWMAWLGASAGLGVCTKPGWLTEAMDPTTVPKATGAAPSTCWPTPAFPEEATVEAAVLLLLTAGVVWARCVAVPTVKYKATGEVMGLHVREGVTRYFRSTCQGEIKQCPPRAQHGSGRPTEYTRGEMSQCISEAGKARGGGGGGEKEQNQIL